MATKKRKMKREKKVVSEKKSDEVLEKVTTVATENNKKVNKPIAREGKSVINGHKVHNDVGSNVKVATHIGVPGDVDVLHKKLEQEKKFAEESIFHFKHIIKEKNEYITILQKEIVLLRTRIAFAEFRVDSMEKKIDSHVLDQIRSSLLTDEDRFNQFKVDLGALFS